jgi:hypothetical protein
VHRPFACLLVGQLEAGLAVDGVAQKFLHNIERVWRPALLAGQTTDLRDTFASRLAMAGVDRYTVQRAGGWKTTVQRYAHLSPEHIRAAVDAGTEPGTDAPGQTRPDLEVLGNLARLEGFEPPTLGLEGRCSIQLSYRRRRDLRYTRAASEFIGPVASRRGFPVGLILRAARTCRAFSRRRDRR